MGGTIQNPLVPGAEVGTTPPTFAQPPGTPQQGQLNPTGSELPPDVKQKIIQALTQVAQRKTTGGTPMPAPVPGQVSEKSQLGMNTANPHAWSTERFMEGLQGSISNAVNKQKQEKIVKATADWEYMQSALNELYTAKSSGDPNAVSAAQSKVDAFMSDPKKMKEMAKALNQDWLNPEKTTVYGEALKQANAKMQQKQQQQQAAQKGIMGVFQKIKQKVQGAPQPELSIGERQAMAREIQSKAPVKVGSTDSEQMKAMVQVLTLEQREELQKVKDQAAKELEQEKEKGRQALRKPVDSVLDEARSALDKGDTATYQAKLKQAGEMAAAAKPPATSQNRIGLIMKANAGDPEAKKALDTMRQDDISLAKARGEAMGAGRAMYMIQPYVDESGKIVAMSNLDAIEKIRAGASLVPSGKMNPNETIAIQQFQAEATPALADFKKNIGAFDNSNDRAIYARIMKSSGTAGYGQESSWIGNVINQALKDNLSPEGKEEAQALLRLNETVGRMRSILGLPATDQAMALTLSLLPGPSTPDSKYAKGQIDKLEQMASLAVGIPALSGVKGDKGNKQSSPQSQPVYKDGNLIGYTTDGKHMTPVGKQ